MPTGFLDTAVKLASAGMSGVCVFMALWSGYMISRLSDNASKEKYRTVRQFMWMCVVLAAVAGGSGVANAYFNYEKVQLAQVTQKDAESRALKADVQAKVDAARATQAHAAMLNVKNLIAQGKSREAVITLDSTINATRAISKPPAEVNVKKSD